MNGLPKTIDIFDTDQLVIPLNLGETHWTVAVADMVRKEIRHYDSIDDGARKVDGDFGARASSSAASAWNDSSSHGGQKSKFNRMFLRYLCDEHEAKKEDVYEDAKYWKEVAVEGMVPQQRNGHDCGVFACLMMMAVVRDFPDSPRFGFSQVDIEGYRLQLAVDIVSGTLTVPR